MISFLGFSWVSVNHLQWCQRKWVVLTFLIFIYFFNKKLLLFIWFAKWEPGTVGNWQNATCVILKLLSFLLYRLRTSWLHQHLFFFTLVVNMSCWLLSLVLRCYLSKERTRKSLSGTQSFSVLGFCTCLFTRPVSWEQQASPTVCKVSKEARERGRRGKEVLRWAQSPLKECPVKFYFSHEVTSFSSLLQNTCLPLLPYV